jgi:hypothetical protein
MLNTTEGSCSSSVGVPGEDGGVDFFDGVELAVAFGTAAVVEAFVGAVLAVARVVDGIAVGELLGEELGDVDAEAEGDPDAVAVAVAVGEFFEQA